MNDHSVEKLPRTIAVNKSSDKEKIKASILRMFCKEKKEARKFDENEKIDCVTKVIGAFGPWQKKFLIFHMTINLISAFHNGGIVFYSARSDFWCADVAQNLTGDELSLIKNQCIPGCIRYEYDRSLFHTTIINEFDLICDKSYLVSVAASVFQIGFAISSLTISYISDRYGRAPTFKAVLFLEILAAYCQSFAPTIYLFLIFRCVLGVASYGRTLTGLLLVMETVGPTKRAKLTVVIDNSLNIGQYIMIAFFYFVPNFRWVQATVASIEIIALFYLHLVPESIRWNIVNQRYDEARTTLRTAAQMNYEKVDSAILDGRIDRLITHFKEEANREVTEKKPHVWDLWKIPKMLLICCVLYMCWFNNLLMFYSTIFNAKDFGSNLYVSFTFLTIASHVGVAMLYLFIERLKRRTLARAAFLAMSICCLALTFTFHETNQINQPSLNDTLIETSRNKTAEEAMRHLNNIRIRYGIDLRTVNQKVSKMTKQKGNLRLWLGMILRWSIASSHYAVQIYTIESMPTVIRQLSVGTCSLVSRVATILAPFTKELSDIMGHSFTYTIFAALSICSFVALFFVPETKDLEIPDTIADCLKRIEENDKKRSTESSCCIGHT